MANSRNSIVETRLELMGPPRKDMRDMKTTAHFLKPTASATEGPALDVPVLRTKSEGHLQVHFNGWSLQLTKWQQWVDIMRLQYGAIWRRAGIYDAITASTCKIKRNNDLILGIAEMWCSATNTFIFPWGEATITLEDMMVLGGFSVLGHHVSLPIDNDNGLVEIRVLLDKMLVSLRLDGKDKFNGWLDFFMRTPTQIVHEAFLSLWLARFVFPGLCVEKKMESHIFPIAAHLARGTRLALAPSVLASIYGDLGVLSKFMEDSTRLDMNQFYHVTLWAPFQFVQVWAWERLPLLSPEPNFLGSCMVRMARWAGTKADEVNVRNAILEAEDTFLWRPYSFAFDGWSIPAFYNTNKPLNDSLSSNHLYVDDLLSFSTIVRPSYLVGLKKYFPYNPNRVSRQFGYDQDLPGWVPWNDNVNDEIAWKNYMRPINTIGMYIPPPSAKGEVSRQYFHWWAGTVSHGNPYMRPLLKGRRSSRTRRDFNNLNLGWVSNNPSESGLEIPVKGNQNALVVDEYPLIPPGFEHMVSNGCSSSMSIDDSDSSDVSRKTRKQKGKSVMEPQLKKKKIHPSLGTSSNKLNKAGTSTGEASTRTPKPFSIRSISASEYRNQVSSSAAKLFGETGNGSSAASDIEGYLKRIEEKLGALKSEGCRKSLSPDFPARVSIIRARLSNFKGRASTIVKELAAMEMS